MAPHAQGQEVQNKGPHGGPAADSGWKIKAEKIKGETCRKDSNHAASWRAGGGGKPEELKLPQDHWRPRLTAGKQDTQLPSHLHPRKGSKR